MTERDRNFGYQHRFVRWGSGAATVDVGKLQADAMGLTLLPNEKNAPEQTSDESAILAGHAARVLTYPWFGNLFEPRTRPHLARLLFGVCDSWVRGVLLNKKQAMELADAADRRTAQRYLGMALEKGLITIEKSTVDKRVDLLRPTPLLIDVCNKELRTLREELQLVILNLQEVEKTKVTDKAVVLPRAPDIDTRALATEMMKGLGELTSRKTALIEEAIRDVTIMTSRYKPSGSHPDEIDRKNAEFSARAWEAAIRNTRDIVELAKQKSRRKAMYTVRDRMRRSEKEILAELRRTN